MVSSPGCTGELGSAEGSRQTAAGSAIDALVSQLYRGALGREGEPQGLAGWTAWMRSQTCPTRVEGVVRGFYQSPEYQGRPLDAAGRIDTLYRGVLGREADPLGKQGWLTHHLAGHPIGDLAVQFTLSAEFAPTRTAICTEGSAPPTPPTPPTTPPAPANAELERYVVMEYEAWHGPQIRRWDSPILPTLSSSSMAALGGGYDSSDRAIIDQHYRWMIEMGVDAVLLDHTNNVACTFAASTYSSEIPSIIIAKYVANGRQLPEEYQRYFEGISSAIQQPIPNVPKTAAGDQQLLQWIRGVLGCQPNDAFAVAMGAIRDNNAEIIRVFEELGRIHGKQVRVIPLLGGYEPTAWEPLPSRGNRTAWELQVEFYAQLLAARPSVATLYGGKPLMVAYFSAPTFSYRFADLDRIASTSFPQLTLRKMGGYLSNQIGNVGYTGSGALGLPTFDRLWTWIDRLNSRAAPSTGPSYATSQGQVESFTVTMANPAHDGWGDRAKQLPTTQGDLRRGGATFHAFMDLAQQLRPRFLFINQFNEFVKGDQGWDEETTNDIEPTTLWGRKYLDLVKARVAQYRQVVGGNAPTPGGGSNPPPSTPPGGRGPIGWLDSVKGGIASGWACDPDAPSTSIAVHLYVGGPAGSGAVVHGVAANQGNEPAVTNACGGGTAHRFQLVLPGVAAGQQVFAYGIDATSDPNLQLSGSPRTM